MVSPYRVKTNKTNAQKLSRKQLDHFFSFLAGA